jgi:hypothetical protein
VDCGDVTEKVSFTTVFSSCGSFVHEVFDDGAVGVAPEK